MFVARSTNELWKAFVRAKVGGTVYLIIGKNWVSVRECQ